jgi:hypothetical protein
MNRPEGTSTSSQVAGGIVERRRLRCDPGLAGQTIAIVPVAVAVMQIGVMRVAMDQRRVVVPVRVWLAERISRSVLMLMMNVMAVPMLVFQSIVDMLMLMLFDQVQP